MNELRHETVLGLDNIPLDLPLARLGSRGLAVVLDYLLVGVVVAVWLGAGALIAVLLEFGAGWTAALLGTGAFLIEWGYFAGSEIVTGGATLGKRALKLRVVTRSGGRPGAAALLARNLVRIVDLVFGGLLMTLDPLSRRLGDWLGGTVVVHVEPRPRGQEVVVGRVPAGWEAPRVALAEALLARAGELDPGHALNLARRVVTWIERDDPALLAAVAVEDDPLAVLGRALAVER